jgi:hypothetical protein
MCYISVTIFLVSPDFALLLIDKGRTLTQTDDGQRRSFPLAVGVSEGKDEAERGGEGMSTTAREGAHQRGQGRAERRQARGGGHGRHGVAGVAAGEGFNVASAAALQGGLGVAGFDSGAQFAGFGWSPKKN